MAQYDGSIRINTKIDTKNASSQMIGLANQIQKTADKIASLRSKMDALKNVQIPTQEYKDIEADIAKAEKELQRLIEKQAQMQNEGKDSGAAWDRLNQRIQAAKDYIETARDEMQQLVDTGKAFTLGRDTDQFKNLGQQLQYEENHLAQLNARWSEYSAKQESVSQKFNKMRSSAKKAFNAINEGTKKSNASLSDGLKTILKYGLGIRSLYVLFNKIRSGIQEGFKNLMGYSDSFANSIQSVKNSMKTLGNQIAGTFRPIVEMVIPWLNSLINALTAAMAKLAQFIALLTGASTFTRAKKIQDAYNKSLGGTAKAADKARGALAKFDDLDVLEKQEDTSGGSAGADTGFNDMFEEVPVDKSLPVWLDSILARLRELKDIFAQGFWDGLGNFEYRWESVKESVSSIKDSLIDIWTDPAVISAQTELVNSVAYIFGSITGSVASVSLTIATNFLGGIAKYLDQNKNLIKNHIVSMFDIGTEINNMISGLSQALAYVFEAFASEDSQQLTANIIGIFADAIMGSLEVIGKLARDILNIFIQPFVENKEGFRTALEGFLSVLSEVAGTIKTGIDETFAKINEVYDEHFKPFFDSIANGLSDTVGKFLKFWNGSVQPILDEWAASFDRLWKDHIQPMLDNFMELLGSVADLLLVLWETILKPLIDWIIENILPVLLPIFDAIYNTVVDVIAGISDTISSIIDVLKGVINFIVGIFTGDWKRAFDGIRMIVEGVMNTIKNIISTILSVIAGIVNTVLATISAVFQSIFNGIASLIKTIFNGIKSTFSTGLSGIKSAWISTWEGMKTSVANIFSGIWSAIKKTINSILGGVENMANGVINAINAMIRALNAIHFDIPDWVPGLGGRSFGLSLGEVPNVSIPRLATGAVIRGGNPFMAILGDQPRGITNIETPLPTMVEAFKQAMTEMGGIRGNESLPVVINLNYDGETFARLSLPDILSEAAREGLNVDVLGVT